ncbi:hypothetical protein ACFL2I_00940 [Candidatus Omnitrophota bacterium]
MDFRPKGRKDKIRVLYLAYNGLLEPLLYSQVITYLRELTKTLKIEIVVLSFEKVGLLLSSEQRQSIKTLKARLASDNIHWYWLRYHKWPPVLSFLYDVFLGLVVGSILVGRKKISFIHARSYVAAIVAAMLSKLYKINYIFDMRAFMVDEWIDTGVIPKFAGLVNFAKGVERWLLENSSYTVVLTEAARGALGDFSRANVRNSRVEVIPCCVDTRRFNFRVSADRALLKKMGLEDKFIFIYIGSLGGKFYLFDKMLDFFSVAREIIPNAQLLLLTPNVGYLDSQKSNNHNQGLFDHISYLSVEPQEIAPYIPLASAGLAFYLPLPSRIATSPVKIGEYLASGIPFAVNRGVGDTEELINRFAVGTVVKDFTDLDYRESVNRLLDLARQKEKTAKICREACEKVLSLDIAIQRYSKIYSCLILRTGRRINEQTRIES